MAKDDNVVVAAPESWMTGWDTIYKQMLDASDEELKYLDVSRPVRQFTHALAVAQIDPKNHHVLELASGDGSVVCYLGRLGCRVEGIEVLTSAVKVANKRIGLL